MIHGIKPLIEGEEGSFKAKLGSEDPPALSHQMQVPDPDFFSMSPLTLVLAQMSPMIP